MNRIDSKVRRGTLFVTPNSAIHSMLESCNLIITESLLIVFIVQKPRIIEKKKTIEWDKIVFKLSYIEYKKFNFLLKYIMN